MKAGSWKTRPASGLVTVPGAGVRYSLLRGAIAQLVERCVRNAKVWGSIPHSSTIMESVGR